MKNLLFTVLLISAAQQVTAAPEDCVLSTPVPFAQINKAWLATFDKAPLFQDAKPAAQIGLKLFTRNGVLQAEIYDALELRQGIGFENTLYQKIVPQMTTVANSNDDVVYQTYMSAQIDWPTRVQTPAEWLLKVRVVHGMVTSIAMKLPVFKLFYRDNTDGPGNDYYTFSGTHQNLCVTRMY